MKSRRFLATAALSLATMIAAVGCGSQPSAPTAKSEPAPAAPAATTSAPAATKPAPASIKVGASVPVTGRYGAGGLQIKAGYEIGIEHINAGGGVMVKEFGKKIPLELVLLDDESDPTKTVARMETMAEKDKIVAYLGGFGSDMHAAAAAIAEKNQLPYLGVAFALESIHKKGYKYLFSPFPKSSKVAEFLDDLPKMVPADQMPKKIAILAEKTDWGKEMQALWREKAPKGGYQIVVDEEYAPGTKDFSDLIGKAKTAGADLVLGVPNPPDGMTIAKQMAELGYKPKVVQFTRAPDALTWGSSLKEIGNGFINAPGWHWTAKYPGVDKLNESHKAKLGRPADDTTGPAYGCIQILADAIERAGTLDPKAIRDAIAKTNLMTVSGQVTFDELGRGSVPNFFNEWVNGVQENIWPKDSATSKLVFYGQ